MEIAVYNQKLQTNDATIRSSREAGDVLIEDLEALKRKLKDLSPNLNWSKFKVSIHGRMRGENTSFKFSMFPAPR